MIPTISSCKQSSPAQSRACKQVNNTKVALKNNPADTFQQSSNSQNQAVSFTGLKSFLDKLLHSTANKTMQKASLELKPIPIKAVQPELSNVIKRVEPKIIDKTEPDWWEFN